MIDEVKFYNALMQKAREIMIQNAQSETGKAFNAGADTLLSYAYIITVEMRQEVEKA